MSPQCAHTHIRPLSGTNGWATGPWVCRGPADRARTHGYWPRSPPSGTNRRRGRTGPAIGQGQLCGTGVPAGKLSRWKRRAPATATHAAASTPPRRPTRPSVGPARPPVVPSPHRKGPDSRAPRSPRAACRPLLPHAGGMPASSRWSECSADHRTGPPNRPDPEGVPRTGASAAFSAADPAGRMPALPSMRAHAWSLLVAAASVACPGGAAWAADEPEARPRLSAPPCASRLKTPREGVRVPADQP